jgi:hypothetical protein
MPLTEQVLAIHNSMIPPLKPFEFEDSSVVEQTLLDRVDERCKNITLEFDEKITVKYTF